MPVGSAAREHPFPGPEFRLVHRPGIGLRPRKGLAQVVPAARTDVTISEGRVESGGITGAAAMAEDRALDGRSFRAHCLTFLTVQTTRTGRAR